MKETEARNFDLSSIMGENTPPKIRALLKRSENHLRQIPDGEFSLYVDSSFRCDDSDWEALAENAREAGWNAETKRTTNGVSIW